MMFAKKTYGVDAPRVETMIEHAKLMEPLTFEQWYRGVSDGTYRTVADSMMQMIQEMGGPEHLHFAKRTYK